MSQSCRAMLVAHSILSTRKLTSSITGLIHCWRVPQDAPAQLHAGLIVKQMLTHFAGWNLYIFAAILSLFFSPLLYPLFVYSAQGTTGLNYCLFWPLFCTLDIWLWCEQMHPELSRLLCYMWVGQWWLEPMKVAPSYQHETEMGANKCGFWACFEGNEVNHLDRKKETVIALPVVDILTFSSRFWLGSCFSVDMFYLNSSRGCDKTVQDVTYPRRYLFKWTKKGDCKLNPFKGWCWGLCFNYWLVQKVAVNQMVMQGWSGQQRSNGSRSIEQSNILKAGDITQGDWASLGMGKQPLMTWRASSWW